MPSKARNKHFFHNLRFRSDRKAPVVIVVEDDVEVGVAVALEMSFFNMEKTLFIMKCQCMIRRTRLSRASLARSHLA